RATQTPFGGAQRIAKPDRHRHAIRARRQIEQGPVNVEKKPDLIRPQSDSVKRVHPTIAFL
ncbi:MAG: hypothetical protein ACHQC9_07060, partial [Alphaproteobacteria bacterium]